MASLQSIIQINDPVVRAKQAQTYIEQHLAAAEEGRKVRDGAIKASASEHGPTKAAKMTGCSLSHVKAVAKR